MILVARERDLRSVQGPEPQRATTEVNGVVVDRAEGGKAIVQNVRLKRQLADQAEELAILKKAAAYFAKHQK